MRITVRYYASIWGFEHSNGLIEPIIFTLHLHTNQAGYYLGHVKTILC